MDTNLLLALTLFIVAFLYGSVGHGGASGYLAVLSIFSIPVASYKPIILILNILVAGIGFIQFTRAGYFKWKLCWPFLISSLPMAYVGSKMPVHGQVYNLILGVALIIPVLRLLGLIPGETIRSKPITNQDEYAHDSFIAIENQINSNEKSERKEVSIPLALVFGLIMGFLSGMLSIGGGIFLSPLLIILAWANAKEAAAASALFIVLNSLSGLLGHSAPIVFSNESTVWFFAALVGGIGGSYFGSRHFAVNTVKYLLSAVLAIASCKLIFFM